MGYITFYSEYDYSCGVTLDNIVKKINTCESDIIWNINDFLDYYNVLKFLEISRFEEYIVKETGITPSDFIKEVNMKCGTFLNNHKRDYLHLYDETKTHRLENYLEVFERYSLYKETDDETFRCFINREDVYLHLLLKNKKIVNHFDTVLKEWILSEPKNAELVLLKYLKENDVHLPSSLKNQEVVDLLSEYINYDYVNPNFIQKIITFPSNCELKLNDKIRLQARRKNREIEDDMFDRDGAFATEVSVGFKKDQDEPIDFYERALEGNGRQLNITVSQDWIEENQDFPTLWNNFLHVFGFADRNIRISFVSKSNGAGLFDKLFTPKGDHLYNKNLFFKKKEMIINIQLTAYIMFLNNLGIQFEEMIKWFFEKYLNEEFQVENFLISVPSKDTSFIEKCKTICPEVDRILKQFNSLVDDGFIDQELMQMSSSSFKMKDIKSLNDKKYVYPLSIWCENSMFYLFSDQAGFYLKDLPKNYPTFFELLSKEKLKRRDFEDYQIAKIDWLIEGSILCENGVGELEFADEILVFILKELYKEDVLNYWNYPIEIRDSIDELVSKQHIVFENSLFTKNEQDFLDYYLNNSKYSNGLALRNRYLHGSNSIDENQHQEDYFSLLKVFIIIVIKINDDLCIKEKIQGVELSENMKN